MRLTFFVGRKAQGFLSKKNDTHASTFEAYRDWTIPLFGPNVIYDNRAQFVEQRDMIKNIVHGGLRTFTPKIEEEYELYVERKGWRRASKDQKDGGVVIDVMEMMSELILQSAGRCLLGKGVEAERESTMELEKLAGLYHDLDEGLSAMAFLMPRLGGLLFPSVKRQCAAREKLEAFFVGVARKRAAARAAAAAAAAAAAESKTPSGVEAGKSNETTEQHEQGKEPEQDQEEYGFLEKLLTQTYKNGDKIQEWEVGRLMIAALFAGQHTSAIAGAYAGLHIANAGPHLMADLLAEQRGVRQNSSSPNSASASAQGDTQDRGQEESKSGASPGLVTLTKESVDAMDLLGGVCLESIRMHPPLIMVMRKALTPLTFKRDTKSGDGTTQKSKSTGSTGSTTKTAESYVVPVGDMCCMSTALSGKLDDGTWGGLANAKSTTEAGPATFDPRRFAAGNRQETNGDFMGFGHGLHKCPGKPFALLDLKVLWSRILREFAVVKVDPVPSEDYTQMVVPPSKPSRIRLVPL
eukprot:g2600.t1